MLRLALLLASAAAAAACNATGTYVDRSGNIATLLVAPDGTIAARSFSATRWQTASGRVIDDTRLWLAFHPNDNETGTLESNCSALVLPGAAPSVWGKVGDYLYGQASGVTVTDVHLVFMNHVDLGYTDLARNVCDEYFTSILPANIALAQQLAGSATPYALTTQSFLLAEMLDGAAGCAHARPPPAALAQLEAAIRAGHLRWHAQSLNYNIGLLDPALLAAQAAEGDALNARFNTSWGTALHKSTDVPGLPRSLIPHLAALGRSALHSGGNAKCAMPRVPQAFTWAHPESGTEVLALVTNDYGGSLVVPPHALVVSYRGDNALPPTAASVARTYAAAAAAYPGAAVRLSSFEAFVGAARASTPGAAALPVLTSELGDSWAYGAGADPLKLAAFRETARVLREARAGTLPGQGGVPLPAADANLAALQRRLLLGGAEHNGGASIGAYLPGSRGVLGEWDNARFHANLAARSDYAFVASSYAEKFNFTTAPLAPAAPVSAGWPAVLGARAARVAALTPPPPDLASAASPWARLPSASAPRACGRLRLALNASTGALASLVDVASGHDWAAGSADLLRYTYRTYAEADFNAFNAGYTPACGVPCPNFAKQGMDSAAPASREWEPALLGAYEAVGGVGGGGGAACSLLLALALPGEAVTKYGGAGALFVQLDVDSGGSGAPGVNLTLSLFNKTATRLAEASWLSFTPNLGAGAGEEAAAWWLSVLDEPVDPLDVVPYGTRHLHAVGEGFGWGEGAPRGGAAAAQARAREGGRAGASVTSFVVQTLDAALVAPGDRAHLLDYAGDALPDLSGGMHVNLHNNAWGTSFRQWWGGSMAFRFRVLLQV